jgi:hypothetical protein
MLQKDKYYVTCGWLKNPSRSFPLHYIFKQKANTRDLMPYLDNGGSRQNGWGVFRLQVYTSNPDFKTYVREATTEEILQYEAIGKPCMSKFARKEILKNNIKKLKI